MIYQDETDMTEKSYADSNGNEITSKHVEQQKLDESNPHSTTAYVVTTIYVAIAAILGIRLFLTLFNANKSSTFYSFIHSASQPLTAPFRNIFKFDASLGNSGYSLEVETVIAMIVYGLIAWVITRIAYATKRRHFS